MTLREDGGEAMMIEVEVSCPDAETARRIARAAVEAGLAACANILPGVESIYLWQGRIEAEPEVALRLKSRGACFEALCALITRLHPYDLPAIIALPLVAANPGYGEWLREGMSGLWLRVDDPGRRGGAGDRRVPLGAGAGAHRRDRREL